MRTNTIEKMTFKGLTMWKVTIPNHKAKVVSKFCIALDYATSWGRPCKV